MRPMEPPSATAHVDGRQVRGLGGGAEPRRRPRRPRQASRPAGRQRHRERARCWAAASAASRNGTSCSKRRCCRRRWRRAGQGACGRARTTSSTISITPSRPSGSRRAWTRTTRSSPGGTAARRRASVRELQARRRPSGLPSNSAWASSTCRSTSRTSAARSGEAQRMRGSAGSARSTTSRTPSRCRSFVAELAHATRPRSQGFAAGADRAGADRRSAARRRPQTGGTTANRTTVYPIDTGRLRRVAELAAEKAGWGTAIAAGSRPRHRGASQLRQLYRHRRRGRGRRQGQPLGAARRYRDRLRLLRQSGAHPLADRGRGGDGALARQVRRDHASRTGVSSRATSTTTRLCGSTSRRP